MPQPPTGTLTFLFTDIEGSTARWEQQRKAMSAALVRHDALLRGAIEERGGHVFKTVGDAFCAVFADPEAALGAAADAQRTLAAEDWSAFGSDFAELRVRMGIHYGKAEERGGDYFGPALNRTARLMSAGHGGQVLLSLAAQLIVREHLAEGLDLRDLGEHRLKDLRQSERIFQLVAEDLADTVKPPKTAEALTARDRVQVTDEAAARGSEGRRYPWGSDWDALKANTFDSRLRRTSPVGVFVTGDSPEGVADLAGNVFEWTSSLFGAGELDDQAPSFAYPYQPADGREHAEAPSTLRRVLRGGSWSADPVNARAVYRLHYLPDFRGLSLGFRLRIAAVSDL